MHLSLNFAPGENLSKEKLTSIAKEFMDRIGFGDQPYLVYQHFDAAHPHIHVVTTNIKADGKRISLHNMGQNQVAQARRAIEKAFQLKKIETVNYKKEEGVKPLEVQKMLYGKNETRQGITRVLDEVLPHYKYTSLAELNAVLRQFNVLANPGSEGSRMYRNKGLTYHALDKKGTKIGIPIKASALYFKPTLKYLKIQFRQNELSRAPYKKQLKSTIDWLLRSHPQSVFQLAKELAKEKISMLMHCNEQGLMYGVTFVDKRSKCVFKGSDLGKDYSAKALQQRCSHQHSDAKEKMPQLMPPNKISTEKYNAPESMDLHPKIEPIIDAFLWQEKVYDYLPYELRKIN